MRQCVEQRGAADQGAERTAGDEFQRLTALEDKSRQTADEELGLETTSGIVDDFKNVNYKIKFSFLSIGEWESPFLSPTEVVSMTVILK